MRPPRYFLQRRGPWVEVDEAGWVAAEREAGFGLHGLVTPLTAGFTGFGPAGPIRGRLVTEIYGIVGSRKFDHAGDLVKAQEIIEARLGYGWVPRVDAVVSGGADGIDKLAVDIAEALNIVTIVHYPKVKIWDAPGGLRDRNELIAQDSDRLLCIRCTASTSYGSGWTADRAVALGKQVERILL